MRDVVTDNIRSTPLTKAPDPALMFATLTPVQFARIASQGVTRSVTRGDTPWRPTEPGARNGPCPVYGSNSMFAPGKCCGVRQLIR